MKGLELCMRIRNDKLDRYIHMIIVTAQDSQMDMVQGLKAGADDYVSKPINFDELNARFEIGVRIVQKERELTHRYNVIRRNYFICQYFDNLL